MVRAGCIHVKGDIARTQTISFENIPRHWIDILEISADLEEWAIRRSFDDSSLICDPIDTS
jgi:hypothetical protein